VEHDDRPPVATFYTRTPFNVGALVTLGESQAHHARVKRLERGDVVRLTSGDGCLAAGSIAELRKSELDVEVGDTWRVAAPRAVHLRVPIGDRERMLWLAEKATELGIASWQAVRFRRSASVSPRGEGPAFAEKVRARMISALEQSGGAWLPALLPDSDADHVDVGTDHSLILLDVRGQPLASALALDANRDPVILFGPEGGLDASELDSLRAAGFVGARLAPTTLRFETAGIAAVAVARAIFTPMES
jgi:16S rRNA (uracil1498-N3)-methyltransferase